VSRLCEEQINHLVASPRGNEKEITFNFDTSVGALKSRLSRKN